MAKKQFKAESKRLLDLMVNSIYTHKEIFLREIISNASDACDKLSYKALTDDSVGMTRKDFHIDLRADKDARTLTVSDNGIGMDKEDLERKLQAGGEVAVSDLRRIAEEAGVPVETVVTFGVPANSIIELAKEKGVDMIVMGGHGQSGVTKFIIGSVVKNVLYRATVPVLVVR